MAKFIPDAENQPVLEVVSLTKILGGRTVVDQVTFAVHTGEVVGFLGPNGAGKTTTIRMMLGLSRPTSGHCCILGKPVPGETLARVGSLIDGPALYPWMSARGNLKALSPIRSGTEADALLQRVGLFEAASRRASTYSQGMKQRLALAIALAGQPDVLVLDEPANGLDPAGIRDFRRLLGEVAETGCAVLLSSHQLGEVELSCDRVLVLNRGRIVAEGPPSELGGNEGWIEVQLPAHDLSAWERSIEALSGLPLQRHEPGLLLVRADSGAEVSRILSAVQVYPDSIAPRPSTLEDRFFALTEDMSE